jgi:putative ATP-dependent DNA ligase
VVLKEDAPRDRRAKYVTSDSSVYDIGVGSEGLLQLPPEYFTGRILRLVLFLDEIGRAPDDDLHRRLGRAFLGGVLDKVHQHRDEGRVYHTYRCRFREEHNARRFLAHMERVLGHVHVTAHRLNREGDYWLLEFDKELPRMTSLLRHIYGGGSVYD